MYLLIYLLTYLFTYLITYLLTQRRRVPLDKLTGSQVVKKFPHFMKPEGSLQPFQSTAICPYPQPDQSSP